ncbi:MAG: glycosyl transferase [Clostridiales bacterium]|nr:glycosyl transferase [Clostridiales bacterium]
MPGNLSAQWIGTCEKRLVACVAGLSVAAPVIATLLATDSLYEFFEGAFRKNESALIVIAGDKVRGFYSHENDIEPVELSEAEQALTREIAGASASWGGRLDEKGALVCDPAAPAPGPHYFTNLLIGNRMNEKRPLQSTPKSVVDRLGRGSFRSHADTQVLATRWDYLPEENGFPANRQFYLTENGKQIFYSGSTVRPGVKSAVCRHAQNRTTIEYELACGLVIRRTIFLLPQKEGLPLAAEAQMIEIENNGDKKRDLRLVCTGMFGTSEVHALREDIIFTTVVAQSEVFYGNQGEIRAISFNPNPKWTKGNIRYSTLMIREKDRTVFPDRFCAKYSEFVGSGTLEDPEHLEHLSCRHSRKGPGFFALSAPFSVPAGASVRADQFVCLTTDVVNPDFAEDQTVQEELKALLDHYADPETLPETLHEVEAFAERYSSYLQVRHENRDYESYVNHNLPFQVFYQTFVSRSFDWTQKGYREIGFREIQDIFASMYYFAGMGRTDFVRSLLSEWAGNVYRDGYANHNFYWKGKEPGWWSDDSLWLLQAIDRYLKLTGDHDFLSEVLPVAGEEGEGRTLSETIRAIITYSSKISVGGHGLPLIDRADWNDCLRVDPDCINGPEKMERYAEQLRISGGPYGSVPFESEYSESVMNGFLLKVAVDAAIGMFEKLGDAEYVAELKALAISLKQTLVEKAWKGDYFARVLFNRKNKPDLLYMGAGGDGLEIEDGAQGTYFLNSFSWSVLSDCADERQILTMLDSLDKNLRTPFGFRVCTGVDYPKIAPKIDVALYYPGDRENGAVFKHANMMAAAAMLQAAGRVADHDLAERLTKTAYWVIDCILPYRTLSSPYETCGNPRFCTQYNNSETGENIGPTLSGTSTWLLLCLFMGLGLSFGSDSIQIDPILRPEDNGSEYTVNTGKAAYHVVVNKPAEFRRSTEGVIIACDGEEIDGTSIPLFEDGKTHEILVRL